MVDIRKHLAKLRVAGFEPRFRSVFCSGQRPLLQMQFLDRLTSRLKACENQSGCRADVSVFEVGSSPLASGVPERKVLRSTSAAPIRPVAS